MSENELENRLNIIESLREKRKRYFDSVPIHEFTKWKEHCLNKINTKYPNPLVTQKYVLYHVFQGGGDQVGCEFFDFPGEESIQKMIEELPV